MTEKRRIFCDQGEDPEDLWAECMEHLKNGRGDKVAARLMTLALERSALRNAVMHLQSCIRNQRAELEEVHAEHVAARERIAELEAALDDARRVRDVPPEPAAPSDTPAPPEASKPPRFTSYEQEQEHSAGFRFSSKRVFVDADTGLEWFFPYGPVIETPMDYPTTLGIVDAVALHGWRLPTPDELLRLGVPLGVCSLIGMSRSVCFWSSCWASANDVTVVRSMDGMTDSRHVLCPTGVALVRSVRSHGQAAVDAPVPPDRRPTPRPRFTIHHLRQDRPGEAPFDSDLIVYDATTGLEWFRPYPTARSYEGAMELVGRLTHNRWRLPRRIELTTIGSHGFGSSDREGADLPEWIGTGPWCWSSTVSSLNSRPMVCDLDSGWTDDGAQMAHVILVRDFDRTRTRAADESDGARHDGLGAREGKEE